MAKSRMINTRFWIDDYISELDPTEKLLFLYFLTNPYTDICGIYEVPLKHIALDTGLDKEMVIKIIERFSKDGKIFYEDGWVAVKNFPKHQLNNPKVAKGIEIGLENAPQGLKDRLSIEYDILPHSNSNSNSNSNTKKERLSLFNSFWNLYPRKVAKGVAEKSFKRLLLLNKDVDIILKDIESRKKSEAWLKEEGKFIPHPSTYLNQRRWEDETKDAEPVKKPYFRGERMVKKGQKWQVIPNDGSAWLEYVGEEKDIEWK
jgi:hypothetical protein